MTPQDLQTLLKAKPFVPFRLYMTDARLLDVHHPEFVVVGHRTAVIFESDDPDAGLFDRYATITLLHVTRSEPLETASPR